MKSPSRNGQSGSALLVIIVLIFLLLFLGFTLWEIWKLIQKLPTTPANQSEVVAGEAVQEFQSNHPGEAVSVVSTQTVTMTLVQPFEASVVPLRIWRSTNLVDWDCIGTNRSGEAWTDTNAPWPNGFYKQEPIR